MIICISILHRKKRAMFKYFLWNNILVIRLIACNNKITTITTFFLKKNKTTNGKPGNCSLCFGNISPFCLQSIPPRRNVILPTPAPFFFFGHFSPSHFTIPVVAADIFFVWPSLRDVEIWNARLRYSYAALMSWGAVVVLPVGGGAFY